MMTQAEILAKGLMAANDADAALIFQPESSFKANMKAPKGTYECERCANSLVHFSGKLGPCSSCETLTPCSCCGQITEAKSLWRRVG